jgi:hypothetical protein
MPCMYQTLGSIPSITKKKKERKKKRKKQMKERKEERKKEGKKENTTFHLIKSWFIPLSSF